MSAINESHNGWTHIRNIQLCAYYLCNKFTIKYAKAIVRIIWENIADSVKKQIQIDLKH